MCSDFLHPKPYFQTLNTHIGAGPILVEPHYDTVLNRFGKQKLGGGEWWFSFSAVPSNSRPKLGSYHEKAFFFFNPVTILNKAGYIHQINHKMQQSKSSQENICWKSTKKKVKGTILE